MPDMNLIMFEAKFLSSIGSLGEPIVNKKWRDNHENANFIRYGFLH